MATLIPLFEQIETTITTNLADLKQRTGLVDKLLDALQAAGIQYDVNVYCCNVTASAAGCAKVSFSINLKNAPVESVVRPICVQNGSDWYTDPESKNVLLDVHGVSLHIRGVVLDLTAERAA